MFKINSSAYWAFAKLYHYTYVIYVTYHSISKLYVDIMNKYYNNHYSNSYKISLHLHCFKDMSTYSSGRLCFKKD